MDFPGNSNKVTDKSTLQSQPEEKKVEKVIQGGVKKRDKSLGRRFKQVIFGGDFKGAIMYVAGDVLLPAFKNMVVDATTRGMERFIYGDSSPRRRGIEPGRPRISYNAPVDRGYRRPTMLPDQPPLMQRRREASEIVLTSREDADIVAERMLDIVDKYESASIADLYELIGIPSNHTDNKWGWTNLTSLEVRQIRDGYLIDLPPVEPL